MYLQEIYQSSNKEMFAISLSSNRKFRPPELQVSCRHAVVIMQTLNWTNDSVRYS
jgi:hypothetical protein